MKAPTFDIDAQAFWQDPYPTFAEMRQKAPICHVPQLGATLLTRRDDIFQCEKNVSVFSSHQPEGLMNVLMGHNMMRKDGAEHTRERKQAYPALSPRTVAEVWTDCFVTDTDTVLDTLAGRTSCDLVTDFAMPVSANALRRITGLMNLTPEQMDGVSQSMINGIANYEGRPEVEQQCHEATALIDSAIDDRLPSLSAKPDSSLLSVLVAAGQPMDSIRANVKLAISGGQNEPRDAIAGTVWALLENPDQLRQVQSGKSTWLAAFQEYARWISPIGMSPRRMAKPYAWNGVDFEPETRAFLMFSSANRDESVFDEPDRFNVGRDNSKSVPFGSGPHYCAGAAASRALIADVALPKLFTRFPNIRVAGDVPFGGWAFRGPLAMPVTLR